MDYEEVVCTCALNRIFGFSPATGSTLINGLGSARNVFALESSDKNELFGPFSKYALAINDSALEWAAAEISRTAAIGAEFVCKGSMEYPALLAECEDAPLGLYIMSPTPPSELFRKTVSIVGTRDISPYGKEWCEKIVRYLSATEESPSIVSGLAFGTDITAHTAALDCGTGTIAIMATGIDSIYPRKHIGIARRMAEREQCALITDYPFGSEPKKINFVRRNRIIAGMSDTTILIESKIRGGGMITARQAFSYNRNVLAIPGRINDIRSQGCNELIGRNEAEAVTSLESLAKTLNLTAAQQLPIKDKLPEKLGKRAEKWGLDKIQLENASKILLTIKNNTGITLTELSEACKLSYKDVAELTGILENDGLIVTDLLQRCSINSKY